MAVQIQWRGDTTAAHETFIGADREITVDIDKRTLVVHDGETPGGFPLIREDMSNIKIDGLKLIENFINDKLRAIIVAAPLESLEGFLLCDGAEVSRTAYTALFATIGTTFGTGDGSTTFNIPDYRGFFLRGLGGAAIANFWETQLDAAPNITGNFLGRNGHAPTGAFRSTNTIRRAAWSGTDTNDSTDFNANRCSVTYGRADEVRPINKSINYFIRF